jgi:plastocyanin
MSTMYASPRFVCALALLVCGLQTPSTARAEPRTYEVTSNPDGTFTPSTLSIRVGDTIEWTLPSESDSVLRGATPSVGEHGCLAPRPASETGLTFEDQDVPLAPGIFVIGPTGHGYAEENLGGNGLCSDGDPPVSQVGNLGLCGTGEEHEIMEATWADPDINGVFLRYEWNDIHLAPGMDDSSFDFSMLDHELDQAVKYGKKVSLSFKAGNDGTPGWLFSEGGVPGYTFEELGGGDLAEGEVCGDLMTLGDPTDAIYQQHYFDLLRKVGEHVSERNDWYDAVAYVKVSGANVETHENRLPNTCQPGCICNTQVWSQAGYTPEGLYDFYLNQMDVIQEAFPGKAMMYSLIQAGFPKVANDGSYMMPNGLSSGSLLPTGVEQTTEIIELGSAAHRDLFVVQHNGLGLAPPEGSICGVTESQGASPECPNRWVLDAGEAGQPTAFQTNNTRVIESPADLQSALEGLWDYSDAAYLEIYERIFWEAAEDDGVLVPSADARTNTVSEWNELLEVRRDADDHGFGPAFPLTVSTVVERSNGKTLYFYNPFRCSDGAADEKSIAVSVTRQ